MEECKYCDDENRKRNTTSMIRDLSKSTEYLNSEDARAIRIELFKKIEKLIQEV